MAQRDDNKPSNEENPINVSVERLAVFSAYTYAEAGIDFLEQLSDLAKTPSTARAISGLARDLGLDPTQELGSQQISVPAQVTILIETDKQLNRYWRSSLHRGDCFVDGTSITTVASYVIWVWVLIRFLQVRYSVEFQIGKNTKIDVSLGTSGVTLNIKQKAADIADMLNRALSTDSPPSGASESPPDQGFSLAHGASIAPAGLSHAAGHLPASANLSVGRLFDISGHSGLERRTILGALDKLYFDSRIAPAPNDGWPSSKHSVGRFLNKPELDNDEAFLSRWPRGFLLSVGERHYDDSIVPHIEVVSPHIIPGAMSQNIRTFNKSRAGQLAEYIRFRVGHRKAFITFSRTPDLYIARMGRPVITPPSDAGPRCLVTQLGGESWALFPGHGIFHPQCAGMSLEAVKNDAISKPISVAIASTRYSRLDEVGDISYVYLNQLNLENVLTGPFVDAAFAKLRPSKFILGAGDYQNLPQFDGTTVDVDWVELKGRHVVTVDLHENIRWGTIEGANTTQDFGIGALPSFTVSRVLLVETSLGQVDFAEPGMSGSIVFLASANSDPRRGIEGSLTAIGYIIGGSSPYLVNASAQSIERFSGSRNKKEYYVQPLTPVLRAITQDLHKLRGEHHG